MVLAPSAQGGRRTPARHHPQTQDRHDRAGRGDRGAPAAAGAHHPVGEPPIAGEGQWSPAGRLVNGVPAVYETLIRPSAIHTSFVVGVAWMDPMLLKATLYSGSQIPGGGPFTHTAPISPDRRDVAGRGIQCRLPDVRRQRWLLHGRQDDNPAADGRRLVRRLQERLVHARAMGKRRLHDAERGFGAAEPRPPRRQRADRAGRRTTPNSSAWGATLGGGLYVWRSALGITANGALLYVGGPGLDIYNLANIMVHAGAVRAMELDINTDWVNFSTYQPSTPAGPATPANGTELLPGMTGTPGRYFQPWWARDFITMSAAVGP